MARSNARRGNQQRHEDDGLRLKTLRAQLQAGVDALERGEFVQVDESDLDAFVSRLVPTWSSRRRR